MKNDFSLSAMTVVTPHEVRNDASVRISDGKIAGFSKSKERDYPLGKRHIMFPALLNAHDHLFGTYYPKIGAGNYVCWLPWDYDLKNSEVYAERNKNSPFDIYLLGSYKNLISGVTTVHDHIPHQVNDPYIDRLPIRVVKDYSLSHECSSYDLKWGDGIDIEYKRAVSNNIPYVTHIEEGWDIESMRGIDILLEHKALSDYTVLIHGLGFSDRDIKQIAQKKANFIWCPGSNIFMFEKTARIKEILDAGINTSIGTDSPATGEINLLAEMRFGRKTYKEMYDEEIDDKKLVEMVTVNPARAFRISDRLGSIEKGKLGDLLIISGDRKKPYKALIDANLKDVALVLMEGKPLYGDDTFEDMFKDRQVEYTTITVEGAKKCVIGDPQAVMDKLRKTVGFHKDLPFIPI